MTGRAPRPGSHLFLAAGAIVVAGFGLETGTIASLAAWVCLFSLPAAFLAAARWPGRLAQVIGLAHLGLVLALVFTALGHDLRYTLAGVLLAISGLHGARAQTARDHVVAVGIQLAVISCGLSQLASDVNGVAVAWLACWLLTAAPQLRLAVPAGGALDWREVRRISAHAGVVVVIAALAWLVLPRPRAHVPPDLTGSSGSDASQAATGPDQDASGSARVGLSDYPGMDLRVRGKGSTTPELVVHGAAALWRAQIFNVYDAGAWSDTATEFDGLGRNLQTTPIPLPDFSGDLSDRSSITVQALQPQRTVLSNGQPLSVATKIRYDRYTSKPYFGEVLYDALGNLVLGTRAGESYSTTGGAPGPAAHAGVAPANASDWLQLPSSLPTRVRTLAKTWTAGAVGAQAQVDAIDNELAAHETYDLDSPVPGSREDPVDDMLFNSHSGFCEQFAAATAVMLRSLGVPARVVSGYAYGTPAGNGTQLVRDEDAHAWVELWSPGKGWIANDPTAGVPLAPEHPVVHEHNPNRLLAALRRVPLWAWIVLALLAVSVGLLTLARRRHGDRVALAREAAALPSYSAVVEAFADLTAALAESGAPRAPRETPADVLLRVPGGWERRAAILPALERELWGPAVADAPGSEAAAQALGQLSDQVRAAALATTG